MAPDENTGKPFARASLRSVVCVLAGVAVVVTGFWSLLLVSFLPGFDDSSVGREILISLPAVVTASLSFFLARRSVNSGTGIALAVLTLVASVVLFVVSWGSANPI